MAQPRSAGCASRLLSAWVAAISGAWASQIQHARQPKFDLEATRRVRLRKDRASSSFSSEGLPSFLEQDASRFDSYDEFEDWREWLLKIVKGSFNVIIQKGEPWYGERGLGQPAYFHMHIPKCAGYSVINDTVHSLPEGTGVLSAEICHHDLTILNAFYRGNGIFTLLRNPAMHVYSMYTECAHAEYFEQKEMRLQKNRQLFDNVTVWLHHFTDNFTTENLGCYHPLNTQTRYFTCQYKIPPVRDPVENAHAARRQTTDVEAAIGNMNASFAVGLVEYYQESLCLLVAKASHKLPEWCNCENKTAWYGLSPTRIDHKVPKHSFEDLSDDDKHMIDQLIYNDVILYGAAKQRFIKEVREQEELHNIKIMCED